MLIAAFGKSLSDILAFSRSYASIHICAPNRTHLARIYWWIIAEMRKVVVCGSVLCPVVFVVPIRPSQDRSYSREINSNAEIKRFDNKSNKSPMQCRVPKYGQTAIESAGQTRREHYYMMCVCTVVLRVNPPTRHIVHQNRAAPSTSGRRLAKQAARMFVWARWVCVCVCVFGLRTSDKSYFDKRTALSHSVQHRSTTNTLWDRRRSGQNWNTHTNANTSVRRLN